MGKRLHILLIDDDEGTNFLHRRIIKKWGRADKVVTARDGQEGLDALTTPDDDGKFLAPALVFVDINMPGMDGWEFLEEYQKLPSEQRAELVVMMLTTSLNPDDRKRAEHQPQVDGFFSKPLTVEHLEEIVREKLPSYLASD